MSFTIVSMASRPKSRSPPRTRRVGLVDEEHALVGLVEAGLHQGRGLADVAGHQPGPVGLHEVAALDHAEAAVDLGQEAGDGGLPGAGVAREDEVAALVEHGQAALQRGSSARGAGW